METQQILPIDTCEVFHGEYFSHANEPMITFNPARDLVYVNAACFKHLPDMDYVKFLIFPMEKRLGLCPCEVGERDKVRLRSAGKHLNRPRHITCNEFMGKITELMQWNSGYRYRLLGNVAICNDETIIAFDLVSAEMFKTQADNGNKISRKPEYSPSWSGRFGTPLEEHKSNPIIKTFGQDLELTVENRGYEYE